jgi:transposase-like protein
MEVIQATRAALPQPPPQPGRGWQGPLRDHPPQDQPDGLAYQRWQLRRATRQAGIAQVHALTHQGGSQRAIARQLGLARQTVRKWQRLDPPHEVPADLIAAWSRPKPPSADALRRAAHQAKREEISALARQGRSYSAIARQVGLHRVTVKRWLLLNPPVGHDGESDSGPSPIAVPPTSPVVEAQVGAAATPQTDQPLPQPADRTRQTAQSSAPLPPWTSWEQVKQVREALHEHRYLLLRRPEHLNADQQAQVAALLASPIPQLQVARSFLVEWYALWKDDQGGSRTEEDARSRYDCWRSNPIYLAEPALRRVMEQMTDAHFERLSPFLRHPRWEATNNGAERCGRAFRHSQAPHFNLRSPDSIDGALAADACRRKTKALSPATSRASRATRGRKHATEGTKESSLGLG